MHAQKARAKELLFCEKSCERVAFCARYYRLWKISLTHSRLGPSKNFFGNASACGPSRADPCSGFDFQFGGRGQAFSPSPTLLSVWWEVGGKRAPIFMSPSLRKIGAVPSQNGQEKRKSIPEIA